MLNLAIYSAPFDNISVSVAQDLFEIAVPSTAAILLLSAKIGLADTETNEQLRIVLKRGSGAMTSGSGGGTITPVPHNGKFASSSCTVERNNTTLATAGTITDLDADGFPTQGGWVYLPTPEERIWFGPSTWAILRLVNAPGAAMNMSGRITWGEVIA